MGLRCQFNVRLFVLFGAVLLAALTPVQGSPRPAGQDLCRGAIAAIERMTGVPDRLMQAIAVVESGRADPLGAVAAWPWTINVEGVDSNVHSVVMATAFSVGTSGFET